MDNMEDKRMTFGGLVARIGSIHNSPEAASHYVLLLEGQRRLVRLLPTSEEMAETLALTVPGDRIEVTAASAVACYDGKVCRVEAIVNDSLKNAMQAPTRNVPVSFARTTF
ncbi:hypothetical protein ACU4GI_33330 [Cupriavidus basilensis]